MKLFPIEDSDTLTILALAGSLDIDGAREIETDLLDRLTSPAKPVILDLSQVDFLASFGIRLLIAAYKVLEGQNHETILLNPRPPVEKVLLAAGIDNLATITHDEAKARVLASGFKQAP